MIPSIVNNDIDNVRTILRSGYSHIPDLLCGAITAAVEYNREEILSLLIERSREGIVERESSDGKEETLSLRGSLQNTHNRLLERTLNKCLILTCKSGSDQNARTLLSHSLTDPSCTFNVSLTHAISNNHYPIVKLLLNDKRVNTKEYISYNCSPLQIASKKRYWDILILLINHSDPYQYKEIDKQALLNLLLFSSGEKKGFWLYVVANYNRFRDRNRFVGGAGENRVRIGGQRSIQLTYFNMGNPRFWKEKDIVAWSYPGLRESIEVERVEVQERVGSEPRKVELMRGIDEGIGGLLCRGEFEDCNSIWVELKKRLEYYKSLVELEMGNYMISGLANELIIVFLGI